MQNLAFLFLACLAVSSHGARENPVGKVLSLLDSLTAKVVKEGEVEQKQYETFAEWCSDTSKEKSYEIDTAKGQAEDLSATIEKAAADIAAYEAAIEKHAASVGTDESDLKSASDIRARENSDYTEEHAKLVETIDTLSRAITILKRELKSSSFVQLSNMKDLMAALNAIVDASVFSSHDKQRLASLIQQQQSASDDDSLLQAPAGSPSAAAYENHSGAIIDTLEDMLEKASTMKSEAEKAEANARHNFEMLKQSLSDNVAFASKEMAAAKKAKAAAQQAKGTAEGDLAATSADLADDSKYLNGVHADCMTKATEWETSQGSRAEELKALATARDVIAKMTGGATAKSYGLLQVASSGDADYVRVTKKVKALAGKFNDEALVQLAFRLRMAATSSADPFAKVKGLIQGMVEKLLADAKAEAGHKAYCDEEMSKTKASIAEKTEEVDDLSAKIDKADALVARLSGEVATLQSELAALAKSQSEMNEMRSSENAAYKEAKKDLEDGIEGISMALKVLRDYYASSFIQQPAVSNHAASTGESTGIIGMLEVIESDFSKNLADVEAAESAAASEYEATTQANEVTKASKDKDVEYKEAEKKKTLSLIAETKDDRSGVQGELDAVLEYYDGLKPVCIAKAEPYAERKARREEEIAGLKEALSILEGAGEAFLQKRAKLSKQ